MSTDGVRPAVGEPSNNSGPIRVQRIEPAYRQMARQIREQIIDGHLRQGQRLPSESELAVLFGVSKSTVREALRTLASQRLIVTLRGVNGGSFVTQPELDHLEQYLAASVGLLSGTAAIRVRDLLEARETLEVPAARLAAVRRSEDDIAALRAALEVERSQPATTFRGHQIVHQAILSASHNPLLMMMTRPIFVVLGTRFLRDRAPAAFWPAVHDDHDEIIERIATGDPERAEQSMLDHLETLRALYEALDEADQEESM